MIVVYLKSKSWVLRKENWEGGNEGAAGQQLLKWSCHQWFTAYSNKKFNTFTPPNFSISLSSKWEMSVVEILSHIVTHQWNDNNNKNNFINDIVKLYSSPSSIAVYFFLIIIITMVVWKTTILPTSTWHRHAHSVHPVRERRLGGGLQTTGGTWTLSLL